MNNKDYIESSLELHLFFDRIMKEHSFFIEVAFTEKNDNLKKVANNFQMAFSNILNRIINLANGNMNTNTLMANDIVTNNTLNAERKTSELSGVNINQDLTIKEMNLKPGNIVVSEILLNNIHTINRETLSLIKQLIQFKTDILNQVLNCKMFTTNYPLLIQHITNEARMYHDLLSKIENREQITNEYLYKQELFWNNIMKEHAEFIRGLLDPTEKNLIVTANDFADKYEAILNSQNLNLNRLTDASLKETIDFRNFKVVGEEAILNCKLKSIIIPLLADHIVREANHFIKLLRRYNNIPTPY